MFPSVCCLLIFLLAYYEETTLLAIHFIFKQICEALGWEGKGGRFDVLPLVLQANGGEPEMFEIPPEIVLEVQMKHPK